MFPASRALFALTLLAALPFGAQAETGGQNPSFNLVNRASQPIRELYVTPAGDTNWGQNRLVNGPLPAGDTFAVRLRVADKCVFDMRIVYADAAKAALDILPSSEIKSALSDIADFCVERAY